MNAYIPVVGSRIVEVGSRFVFLGLCLRELSLAEYGAVSFKIALYQFFASALAASALAGMSKIRPEALLVSLVTTTTLIFSIILIIDSSSSLIFLFYGLLYILNGWYGVQKNQLKFSMIRSLAFASQLIWLLLQKGHISPQTIFLSFIPPAVVLLTQLPYTALFNSFLTRDELKTYMHIQFQSITFQFTKISERWIAKIILDEQFFGLFSSFRDLVNAVNLTVFSPLYQTKFKSLSMGEHIRPLLRQWGVFWIIVSIVAGLFIQLGPSVLNMISEILNLKFTERDYGILTILVILDFFKAFFLMNLEANHRLRSMFYLNVMDVLLQMLFLALTLVVIAGYFKLVFFLVCRGIVITILTVEKNRNLMSLKAEISR